MTLKLEAHWGLRWVSASTLDGDMTSPSRKASVNSKKARASRSVLHPPLWTAPLNPLIEIWPKPALDGPNTLT